MGLVWSTPHPLVATAVTATINTRLYLPLRTRLQAPLRPSTKLAQTEEGVDVLKGAYRTVCEQARSNQYCASGTWTSSTTFGNLEDFLRNILEVGYYIFSSSVANQLPADRAARIAPLIQIALKEAGAIHSADVIININA